MKSAHLPQRENPKCVSISGHKRHHCTLMPAFSHPDFHCRPWPLTKSACRDPVGIAARSRAGSATFGTPYRRSGISPCPEAASIVEIYHNRAYLSILTAKNWCPAVRPCVFPLTPRVKMSVLFRSHDIPLLRFGRPPWRKNVPIKAQNSGDTDFLVPCPRNSRYLMCDMTPASSRRYAFGL